MLELLDALCRDGDDVPVGGSGMIPPADAAKMREAGVVSLFSRNDDELIDVLVSGGAHPSGTREVIHRRRGGRTQQWAVSVAARSTSTIPNPCHPPC